MQITIGGGTILGVILAVIFAIAGGYASFAFALVITWGKEKIDFIMTALTLLGAAACGWAGWVLGHWFCS